jgi:uncharacterized protein YfaS (alpha-2-macroglobulin family)
MSFELRFDQPMVGGTQVGVPVANLPLVITPPIAGTLTWSSARNGAFNPTEPLALGTHYELRLRPGLLCANGQPSKATLYRSLTTPAFSVITSAPREANTNAASEPEVKVAFNADVRAREAERYFYFRDEMERRIPADVRQALVEDAYWQLGGPRLVRTWLQQYEAAKTSGKSAHMNEVANDPTNELSNVLIATPHQPLLLGKGWRLVVGPGTPARDGALHLSGAIEVPIGDITPFVVTEVTASHYINSGPRIRLTFSKPVPNLETNDVATWMEISPAATNINVQSSWRDVTLSGDFKGGTSYRLRLRPDFHSAEPFRLTGSNTFTLKMPHLSPRLYFPAFSRDQLAGGKRSFPLLAVNVPQVRVRAKLLNPQTAIHALRGYGSYFASWRERQESGAWDEPFRPIDYNLVPGRTVFNEQLDVSAEPDTTKELDLGWDKILAGRKTGIVFLDAARATGESESAPALGTQALIQLTDLGLIWKKAAAGVDVFAFSHASGRPMAGATVRLLSDENEPLSEAVIDASGVAHLLADTNAVWVAAQLGDDFHAAMLKDDRVWMYHFNLPCTGSDEQEPTRRVMLVSDRDVYRPGEELHLEALVRDWSGQGLSVPVGLTGSLACLDPRGRQFFQTNATLSSCGSWSALVPLTISTRGTYSAKLCLGTKEYVHAFHVQDFQPSAFEIALKPKAVYAAGERIEVPLSARYLFGKALSRARVEWALEAEDTDFKPERFGGFTFRRTDSEYRFGRNRASLTLSGQGILSGSSNFVIAPELPLNATAPQPRTASLLVEVTDRNQQTLSRRAEFVQHSSDFYLGLRQGSEVLTGDQIQPLEIVAVRSDGQPWPETVNAQITLQRIDWQPIRIQGAGRTIKYRNEAVVTNIYESQVEVPAVQLPSDADAEVRGSRLVGFPILPAGHYLLEAKAQDGRGRPVVASLSVDVSARAEVASNYRNDVQLTLKPGRKAYMAGDTAEILVEAPFTGTALVTVEREKVLRSLTRRLEGNVPSISVPLEPGDVPNVFVSVTLVRGADECPRKVKEPEYRIGYCNLTVADPQSQLVVRVIPGATNYLPAQTVEVTVEVSGAHGNVVSGAEVVLYAVDDGILQLTDYGLPDPHSFFYSTRPLGVQTSISLPNLLAEDSQELTFHNKGYFGGGGGMEHVRKNFLACAFWNAALKTDALGKTGARFVAPDSLTRYRIFAVAHTSNSRFGSGQSSFEVSKPLLIEPALPRFVNITDRLIARGLIQNQTANAGEVLVTLDLDNRAKAEGAPQSLRQCVTVPANGSAVVEFPAELVDTGDATWVWKARFTDPAAGDFTDSVQSVLEVGHVVPMLREIILNHTTGSQTNLLASVNPRLLAGRGTVTVSIANTRLNDLGEAILQLLHYPYGCAEQTGSSLLPWIVLRDQQSLLPLLHLGTNDMERAIHAGIARLIAMQTESGGLGYWPRASEPMLWASAYGGMVLALAQRQNIAVPVEEFGALMKYLGREMRSAGASSSDLSDYCLGLYALALAGQAEPAYHEKLYALREKLGSEDRALLALAIAESHGSRDMVWELLRPSPAAHRIDEERFGCAAREQAIRLLAWVHYRPSGFIIDELVSDLMRGQQQGHWGTTQGDAWALLALSEYERRVEGKLQPSEGQLICGTEIVPFRLDDRTNLLTRTFSTTNGASAGLSLVNVSTNRLYTSVMIEARPPETDLPPQDRGFSVQRRYDRLDDNDQLRGLDGLRVGDRVLVTLNVVARDDARWVAIDDALPSILEGVNPEFKTQEARSAASLLDTSDQWLSNFREIRKDRCLYFADYMAPGNYTLRYVARVRAAGKVTAPPVKVEEMYHPERYGLSGTQIIASQGME